MWKVLFSTFGEKNSEDLCGGPEKECIATGLANFENMDQKTTIKFVANLIAVLLEVLIL